MFIGGGFEEGWEGEITSSTVPLKKRFKNFLSLSNFRIQTRTDEMVDLLKKLIDNAELIDGQTEEPINISQLLGYF